VRLCTRAPYAPHEMADHHRSGKAALHACATCDREQRMLEGQCPAETHRRRKCSTILSTSRTAQRNNAPFATESSASSVTIPGEPPFVQRGALNSSSFVGRATADGCGDLAPPEEVAAGSRQRFPAAQHFATRSRQVERSMQAPLALLLRRRGLGDPLRRAVPLIENRASVSCKSLMNRSHGKTKGADTMKFILVNHRTPRSPSSCIECSRSLETGYLRDVSTQRRYCDHHCYLRYEAKSLFMPWLAITRADHGSSTNYPAQLGMITSLAAASCWCYAIPMTVASISLVESALRMHDLIAAERFRVRIPS